MNKAEFADRIAAKVGIAKSQVEACLDAFEDIVTETLKSGGEVTLTGFGNFLAKKRAARTGVNPQTGAKIQVAAVTVPKFRAGKRLKDAVKG